MKFASHPQSEAHLLSASQMILEAQSSNANLTQNNVSQREGERHFGCASHLLAEAQRTDANLSWEERKREKTQKWEEKMREAFGKLKYPRLRILYENYLDLQNLRIALNNRITLYKRFEMLTPSQHYVLSRIAEDLERKEKEVAKLLEEEVELVPIWNHWLSRVKGIGPVMGAGVITWIDRIDRFPTVSKLWAYAVGKPGERREKNKKVHYNPKFKTLCWKIGMQFLKARGGYAELYRGFRAGYEQREDLKKVEKGSYKIRVHLMALRKTVKIFLQHLWVKWREAEGLPTAGPYVIDKLGHTSYIPPIEDKETVEVEE